MKGSRGGERTHEKKLRDAIIKRRGHQRKSFRGGERKTCKSFGWEENPGVALQSILMQSVAEWV